MPLTRGDHPVSAQPLPVIDMHVHAYSHDPRFGTQFTNPLTGMGLTAARDADALLRETFEAFDRYNVVKAMVSGDYEATLRLRDRAPDRIIVGYGFSDPSKVDLDFLRTEHAAGRLHVLGEVLAHTPAWHQSTHGSGPSLLGRADQVIE